MAGNLALLLTVCTWQSPFAYAEDVESRQQKKSKSPKPVGMVNSSNGGVYGKGEYGVILKYITNDQDQLYSGTDSVDFIPPEKGASPGKKVYEKSHTTVHTTLRAGITENMDARLVIPFHDKELKRQSFSQDFSDDSSGLGDMKLFARYSLVSQKNNAPYNLAIGLGVKMPTGETDEQDSSGATPSFLQSGSGSWDPIVEIGAHKVAGRHWFSTYFMYQLSTEGEVGDLDFEKPDVFKYNFGYAYAVSRLVDFQVELNGEYKTKAELDGVDQQNSGGHMLYVTPGVHYKFYKKMHCDIGVAIPVYRDLNGTQPSEDYRVIAKLALKF